jgi:hypothetical protein
MMSQENMNVESFGGNVYRVRATIANRGALPTYVTNKGKELGRFQTVLASLRPAEGVTLLSSEGHVELGHLSAVTGHSNVEWFVQVDGASAKGNLCLGTLGVRGAAGGDVQLAVHAS